MWIFSQAEVLILVQRYEFLSKSQLEWRCFREEAGAYPCAKIRIFKQITTEKGFTMQSGGVLILVQRYEFLSKSQPVRKQAAFLVGAYPCAKIRIFKQITTCRGLCCRKRRVLILVQRYEFLSKSQLFIIYN